MTSNETLIRDLEVATEGSRELDEAIGQIQGYKMGVDIGLSPHYTTSLDAALTLMPENWAWIVEDTKGQGCGPGREGIGACVWNTMDVPPIHHAETPILALCIAAIKARSVA